MKTRETWRGKRVIVQRDKHGRFKTWRFEKEIAPRAERVQRLRYSLHLRYSYKPTGKRKGNAVVVETRAYLVTSSLTRPEIERILTKAIKDHIAGRGISRVIPFAKKEVMGFEVNETDEGDRDARIEEIDWTH